MNKKLFIIICIAFIAIGSVISYFANIPESQLVGLAVTMFGAGGLCSQLWKDKKPSTKGYLVILSMALVGVGSFMAGAMSILTEDKLKMIITLIISLVVIIAGILTSTVAQKKV